ncbi:MAG: AraC family transcriptional regulator [Pseudomonadota bacterium]
MAPRLLTLAQWTRSTPWRATLPHSCEEHAFLWLTRGQGRCLIAGRRRGIGVHTALVIPAGSLFSLQPSSQNGAQSFGLVCLLPKGGPTLMPDEPQLLRITEQRAQSDLTMLFEAMQREQNEARPFTGDAMSAQGELLTVWLKRAMVEETDPETPTASQRLVDAYCALVERDYTRGLPMQDYARRLGVTPTHLTRVCKATTGMTALEILTGRVLYAARDMLETTRLPAKQIAARLGFRSAAYFSRFIHNHTGHAPRALRQAA